jgi:hypothetical protein
MRESDIDGDSRRHVDSTFKNRRQTRKNPGDVDQLAGDSHPVEPPWPAAVSHDKHRSGGESLGSPNNTDSKAVQLPVSLHQ